MYELKQSMFWENVIFEALSGLNNGTGDLEAIYRAVQNVRLERTLSLSFTWRADVRHALEQ